MNRKNTQKKKKSIVAEISACWQHGYMQVGRAAACTGRWWAFLSGTTATTTI
jgi:hypothetical protein